MSNAPAPWSDSGSAARAYIARGFAPIPVPHCSKRAALADWPNLRIYEPDVESHFPPDQSANIGLLNGAPSNDTVDVDLDTPEAIAAAPFVLPVTAMISGRASAPRSHYWYAVEDGAPQKATTQFVDPVTRGGLLVELRSSGGMTLVPPSIYPADPEAGHPSPEPCVWWQGACGEPTRLPRGRVLEAVGTVAAAALLGRYWPRRQRHTCALALAGGLLRRWPVERVETFIRAVCAAARDEEVEHRVRDVHDTSERLQRGEAVTGFPALVKELGENGLAILNAVTAWLVLPQKGPHEPKITFGRSAPKAPPAPPFTPLPEWRPFPVDLLPGAVREFVTTVSTAMRCDLTYVALPVLAVCSGMIGATRTIRLKKSWSEPAMLWTAVVGESGTLKTPPYKRAIAPVVAMQTEQLRGYKAVHEQYRADLREYERAKRRAKDDDPGDPPAEPVCPRIYSRDVTVEALAGILTHNRTRFLIGRDELSGWLASFNQYKSKGGSDLANWLELHGLGTLSVDRKTGEQKTILVSGVGVSLCGGIQPGVLRGALSAQHFSAGIPARLLFAYPPRHAKQWTEDDLDEHVEERYTRLVRALAELQPNTDESGEPYPVPLGLAPDAKAEWVRFYQRFALKQSSTEGELAAAFSKLEGYAARLALVHHVCLSVDAGLEARDPIPLASVRAGIALAEWFAHEAQRVYQMLREDRGSTEARDLYERVCQLAARHGGRVTARELAKSNKIKYPQAAVAEAALEGLVAQGLGDWIDLDTGPKGGRPTHGFVPHLLSGETGETPETPDAPDDDPSPPPGPDAPRSGETPPAPTGPHAGGNDASDCEYNTSASSDTPPAGVSGVSPQAKEKPPSGEPQGSAPHRGAVGPTGVSPHVVKTAAGVEVIAAAVAEWSGPVALDTETTGLDPTRDRVRLVQIAIGDEVALVDLFALPDPAGDLAPLFAALAGKEIIGHNVQFDTRMLAPLGFVPGRVYDTMLASKVLHAGGREETNARLKHGLADVVERELGRELDKGEQGSDWSGQLSAKQLAYAAADVAVLHPLAAALTERLAAAKLTETADREMRALPGIAWAEPIAVDTRGWLAIAAAAEAERASLATAMDTTAPNPAGLPGMETRNWDSPAQVKDAFAQVGVTLGTTDDDTLAGVPHPLAGMLRDYRAAAKRVGTYGRGWIEKHVGANDLVLPSWNQLGAESGRMSCSDPNLQQIPRGSEYRRCFVARPGRVLLKADYSQVELRIAAKVANEGVMIAAYRDGRDLHTLTAARVLNKPEADVTKADRQLAKAVNFGLLYGMGWRGLKQYAQANYGVALTDAEARGYRDAFFRAYPALRAWHARTEAHVKKLFDATPEGVHPVHTLGGRRRLLLVSKTGADGSRYPNKTDALNTPVQGTGADGLKVAIALLWERRDRCPGAVPVIFCHDEIVLEVPEADAERGADWLRGCMIEAVAPLIDPVPVEVEVTTGRTWGG